MWKPKHRLATDRRDLRYPSDLTDAEWTLIAPLIPPANAGDASGRSTCARFSMRSSTCSPRAANGKPCQKTCRPRARRIHTSCCGTGAERWTHSRNSLCRRPGSGGKRRRAPRRRSSTRRAPRPLKRGRNDRSAGLRREQEGHGPQAPRARRHARSPARRERSTRQHSGSRRRSGTVADARGGGFPSSKKSSPTPDIRDQKSREPSRPQDAGKSRSSNDPIATASSSCPSDGSSNELSPGSAAIVVSRAISNATRPPSPPSSDSP